MATSQILIFDLGLGQVMVLLCLLTYRPQIHKILNPKEVNTIIRTFPNYLSGISLLGRWGGGVNWTGAREKKHSNRKKREREKSKEEVERRYLGER